MLKAVYGVHYTVDSTHTVQQDKTDGFLQITKVVPLPPYKDVLPKICSVFSLHNKGWLLNS
jgi:hypothetical protein